MEFLVHINYPEDEWVYGMLLSYGPYAKVLSPSTVKEKVKQRLQAMQKRYEEDVETIALHTQETKEKSSVDADGIAFKKERKDNMNAYDVKKEMKDAYGVKTSQCASHFLKQAILK